jgi:hypothetical protein
VAELVDALVSGASGFTAVGVRVPPFAPFLSLAEHANPLAVLALELGLSYRQVGEESWTFLGHATAPQRIEQGPRAIQCSAERQDGAGSDTGRHRLFTSQFASQTME